MSLPRGEDALLHDHAGEGALPLLGLRCRRRRDRLRDQARPRQLRRCARDTRAGARGSTWSKLMEGRPRILQKTPLQALNSPKGPPAPPHGRAPPWRAADNRSCLKSWSTTTGTFCAREDAQTYLANAIGPRQALKIGYANGSLLKTIPKDGDVRAPARRARRDHARGPRAPRRLHRHPDPRPAHRPVDEPLRTWPSDPSALLPPRPFPRCPQLPGRARLSPRSVLTEFDHRRSLASTRPASPSRSRSTARTASRRTTSIR